MTRMTSESSPKLPGVYKEDSATPIGACPEGGVEGLDRDALLVDVDVGDARTLKGIPDGSDGA